MSLLRKRAITFAAGGTVFLAVFLHAAGWSMPWRPLLLAVGGVAVIVGLLLLTIWAVECNDAKHARANMARIRAAEGDDVQRKLWEVKL